MRKFVEAYTRTLALICNILQNQLHTRHPREHNTLSNDHLVCYLKQLNNKPKVYKISEIEENFTFLGVRLSAVHSVTLLYIIKFISLLISRLSYVSPSWLKNHAESAIRTKLTIISCDFKIYSQREHIFSEMKMLVVMLILWLIVWLKFFVV